MQETKSVTQVGLGSEVTLEDEAGKKNKFVIVGEFDKAAIAENTISAVSLIGSALMQKKVGEKITVKVPAGEKTWKIKAIN